PVTAAQGLLTNDVEKPGDGAFVYGALLTPKGMIVVDAWVARLGATMSFAVAAEGRERALAIFTRSVPPRLARLADRTTELAVYRLAGPNALAVAEAAGLPVPSAPGRVLAVPAPGTSEVARATEAAPFTLQLTFPTAETEVLTARLTAAGAVPADAATLELARVLAGWPRLGAEVDDKTIPQEVRYDELGGVSYTKGCYTGQETVSRLHFRGHTNRYLRGLLFDAEPPATPADGWSSVTHLDRDVGRVTSLAWVPESGVAGGGRCSGCPAPSPPAWTSPTASPSSCTRSRRPPGWVCGSTRTSCRSHPPSKHARTCSERRRRCWLWSTDTTLRGYTDTPSTRRA